MKILLISDIHFGINKNSTTFVSVMEDYFYNNITEEIKRNNIEQLWILGDLFHDRKLISTYVKISVFKIFDHLLGTFPNLKINILLGNHDIYYKNSLSITSLRMFFDYHERLHIIKGVEEFDLDGCKTIVFPWLCENSIEHKRFLEIIDAYDDTGIKQYNLCLGHFEIHGFEVITGVTHSGTIKIPQFAAFDDVFSGHFHIRQKIGNIQYCGCPYELNWGDYNDPKGMTLFDTKTRQATFIENTTSPKHIKIKTSDALKDKSILKTAANNWVKVFTDEALTVDQRIDFDTILQSTNPIDVSWIDQTQDDDIDDEDIEVNVELEGNEINFMNEYVDQLDHGDTDSDDLKKYGYDLFLRCSNGRTG